MKIYNINGECFEFTEMHAPGSMGTYGNGNFWQKSLGYPIMPTCTRTISRYSYPLSTPGIDEVIPTLDLLQDRLDLFVTVAGSASELTYIGERLSTLPNLKGIILRCNHGSDMKNMAALSSFLYEAAGFPILLTVNAMHAEAIKEKDYPDVQGILLRNARAPMISMFRNKSRYIPVVDWKDWALPGLAYSHKYVKRKK